ncbi:rap guanine nucleotide exchange factor 2-like [Oppia nitens]|uniref:rap guanine nucleotide exchange factor 2-like n=1 Tax=Oppia nitens TaxID=1686743 RepID=UPI0023DB9908|nr:rap guanine nucleotide exchange factor 2-like [Oppia nitens]
MSAFASAARRSPSSAASSLQSSRVFDFDGLEESLVDDARDDDATDDAHEDDDVPDDDADDARQRLEQSFHRIRNALIRDATNRSDEDIDLIDDFLRLVSRQSAPDPSGHPRRDSALARHDANTRRLLARHMVLAEIEARDTRVLTHGERLDAYCVVACGSLRHVIPSAVVSDDDRTTRSEDSCVDCADGDLQCTQRHFPTESVRYLTVGDEFGASLDDRVVFGEIFTAEDFVWVLCVPHVIFDDICGQKQFRTLVDDNNAVIEVRDSQTNELIRATRDRLVEMLLTEESSSETTPDSDDDFIADFLLTFRLFWSEKRDPNDRCVDQLMERVLESARNERTADRSVKVVLLWLSNHFQDFRRRKHLLRAFETTLRSKIHKKLFYLTLSSKARDRHVTITRSDRNAALPFSLIGGYEVQSRLFVSEVSEELSEDLQPGDRLLAINGVDCHVMEVGRALGLCRASTHLSLVLRFDPSLFDAFIDGQNARQKSSTLSDTTTTPLMTSSHASFASLKPLIPLSSTLNNRTIDSQNNNSNNNWKQKVKQIVQIASQRLQSHTTPPTLPPDAPDATPEVVKVYFESDFRFLPVMKTTTARECIQLALIEFQLSQFSSRDFALFEYRLLDRKLQTSAVKRLSENSQNLANNLGVDARLVLKSVAGDLKQSAVADDDITRDIARESTDNSLLSLDGEAIARELTDRDLDLFGRIEAQQFVQDLEASSGTTTTTATSGTTDELKAFEDRTNEEMFWTINCVLFAHESPQKRVKSVKQLIRVAHFCRQMQNFNSLFAILSGLSHSAVERQKTLWDKLPNKSLQKLQKLYLLMDPSRNFHSFRSCVRRCLSPVIPFFPLVKKDLSFIWLANESRVQFEGQTLINWQKMRLLSTNIREVTRMAQMASQTPQSPKESQKTDSYRKLWEKQRMKKRVQQFLDASFTRIVCDENLVLAKSLECEPPPHPSSGTSRASTTTLSSSASVVQPSPTLSSHSSSPSLSSSTTNSSADIASIASGQRLRLRFGQSNDSTALRKLLALSDHCVQHPTPRPPSLTPLGPPLTPDPFYGHYLTAETRFSSHLTKALPTLSSESSSVTSLRRLQQLRELSRFRHSEALALSAAPPPRRHPTGPPTYDQTIERLKKKLNKNEENVV